MSRVPRLVRQVVLVVLCLAQLAAVASAAPRRSEPRTERSRAHLERFRVVLELLWSKYGAGIDPDGAPASGTTTQGAAPCQGEYGAGIDPNGQCGDGR